MIEKINFEYIFVNLPGIVFLKDLNGCYQYCNFNYAKLVGANSPEEIVGKSDKDFFSMKNAKIHMDYDKFVIDTEMPTAQKEIFCTNNSVFTLQVSRSPYRGKNGKISGVICNAFEITSETQDNIENEVYLKNIMLRTQGSIYWKNKDGIYLGCNQFVADLAGLASPDDIIGKSDYDLSWKNEVEFYRKNDLEVMQKDKVLVTEEPMILSDGRKTIHYVVKAPLKDQENNIIGIIGTSLDITELKQSQKENEQLRIKLADVNNKLLTANQEKKLFMFIVSTRVRNHLSGVEMAYQIFKNNLNNLEHEGSIDLLEDSVNKILRIYDHVMDYLNLSYYPPADIFNIKETIELSAREYSSAMYNKRIMTAVNYDRNIPDKLIGESRKIRRIIEILLDNALTYSNGKLIFIDMLEEKRTDFKITIRIVIADDGIGISKEKIDGLFCIFERTTLENPYKSGGLILSLTKRMVDSIGGKIEVDSKKNKGTTFSVTLQLGLIKNELESTSFKFDKNKQESLVFAREPWFAKILQSYIPINKLKLISDDKELKQLPADFLNYHIIFIDGFIECEKINKLILKFQDSYQDKSVFIVIIGLDESLKDHLSSLKSNLIIITIDIPLSPKQFYRQFVLNYEKWKKGEWTKIKNTITRNPIRVLYAEDEAIASKAVAAGLTTLECIYQHAHDGEELINITKNDRIKRFDIIFLDLGLPGINGFEAAVYLKKHHIYKDIPIIAVTAFVSEEDTKRCFEAGMNDVITKPITLKDIKHMLNIYVIKSNSAD